MSEVQDKIFYIEKKHGLFVVRCKFRYKGKDEDQVICTCLEHSIADFIRSVFEASQEVRKEAE